MCNCWMYADTKVGRMWRKYATKNEQAVTCCGLECFYGCFLLVTTGIYCNRDIKIKLTAAVFFKE